MDVPVLVKNFRDSDNNAVNEEINYETSKLVHRFFVYDTVSGIDQTTGYRANATPAIIRYASSVKVVVQMDPDAPESIRKPLLEIEYTEHLTSLVTETSYVPVSFEFDYYEDGAQFERSAEIMLYVFNALVLLILIVRMYYWVKMNPPKFRARSFAMAFAWKLVFYVCDIWSNVMFLVYFIITAYWFIMYKLQSNAYILMPQRGIENSTYDLFYLFLVIIIAAKAMAILLTVFDQSSADVFVMDWERYEHMKMVEVENDNPVDDKNQKEEEKKGEG